MSDFKLTAEGDIAIENGDFVIIDGNEAVAQDLRMTLRMWLGESAYDRTAGTPYQQVIFAEGTTIEAVRFVLESLILSVDGIAQVVQLEPVVDRQNRKLTVSGEAGLEDGSTLPFSFGDEEA